MPSPPQAARGERDGHAVTHVPDSSWCDDCVEGCGREMSHAAVGDQHRSVPAVSFDYASISDKGDLVEADETAIKILVVRDNKSKALCRRGAVRRRVLD